MVTLTIDGRTVSVPEGTTILEAAQTLRISIPTLCYLKDINEIGACRICMVEVEGYARLVPSCDSAVSEGMVVYTSSPRVREARRVNLRLLLSQHETKCTKCTRSGNCKLQQLTNDYNLLGDHYIDDLKNIPTDYSNPVVRIENRCVKCMRCIQVCEKIQVMGIWDLMGTGTRTTVGVAHTRTLGESDCTFCGQCITHCPVGGLQEHDDTGKVFDALANKDRITVVQVAPAVRAAWAEFYHLDPKFATAERMVTALKTMGFDTICLKDMAGTMSPNEAEQLFKGIKDAGVTLPLILHTHCTTGMAYMTVTKAIESGIDVIDCATSCFSNGTSQPATETIYYALSELGIETGLNEEVINKVNDYFKPVKQKYIDSGSEEVFSAWLTGGGGMASGTYESIYGQYASSLAALADRLYSKWEASGTSMTFPVWLDSQQVSMDSLSENADEPDTDNANDPQTSDAPDDVPDGQDTEGGASGNSVWEIIGTVVRENPIIVWSIVAVIVALIIVGAVRRYHKVKRDEHDEK